MRHADEDGVDAVVDGVDAVVDGVDAVPAPVVVGDVWLALVPQPPTAKATAIKAATTIQARRTAHKQTRSSS